MLSMNKESITFISNDVKGIQNSIKRIKIHLKYISSYVTPSRFIFSQEAHSSVNVSGWF